MARVTTFLNRILTVVFCLFGGTRIAVARLIPWYQPVQKSPAVKVFALSDAAWMDLRAGSDVPDQEASAAKSSDDQKDSTKKGDDTNARPKSADATKAQAKGAECDKSKSKQDENKGASPNNVKDAAKPDECDKGPGGGDGDMGGTGG